MDKELNLNGARPMPECSITSIITRDGDIFVAEEDKGPIEIGGIEGTYCYKVPLGELLGRTSYAIVPVEFVNSVKYEDGYILIYKGTEHIK